MANVINRLLLLRSTLRTTAAATASSQVGSCVNCLPVVSSLQDHKIQVPTQNRWNSTEAAAQNDVSATDDKV